jgi:hypothetical protein
LGVTFQAEDGKLSGIVHLFEQPLETTREEARRFSIQALECLLLALRFLHLKPVRWWADARRLVPPENEIRVSLRASAELGPRQVTIPTDGWFDEEAARLAAWLNFASEAQETSSPATALRLYYLVLEELADAGTLSADSAEVANCLGALRDFVSHLAITREKTVARLKACAPALEGPGGFRYDPNSGQQRAILNEWRQRARSLIDRELRQRLGLAPT